MQKDFQKRGYGPIVPGCGETGRFSRGASFAVCDVNSKLPQSISDIARGLGFPHRVERCRPGEYRFSFRQCCSMYGGLPDPGMGPDRLRVALAIFSTPSQSVIARWGWGFHTMRGGIDPWDHYFVPDLSEL